MVNRISDGVLLRWRQWRLLFPISKSTNVYYIRPSEKERSLRAGRGAVLFVLFCFFWPEETNDITSVCDLPAHCVK